MILGAILLLAGLAVATWIVTKVFGNDDEPFSDGGVGGGEQTRGDRP